jgi:predicted double-glycine peptidase
MAPKYHDIPKNAIHIPVPDTTQQTDYTCGASSLEAVCKYFGVGPDWEFEFKNDMRMPRSGADPEHIITALKKYGLEFEEFYPMSLSQLKDCLDRQRPVIVMLQAWGETEGGNARRGYKQWYDDGHWVVAIGYDDEGVFFEDPSLQAVRGFIPFAEFEERWHDYGPHFEHMDHYGVAIWKSAFSQSSYERRARRIE